MSSVITCEITRDEGGRRGEIPLVLNRPRHYRVDAMDRIRHRGAELR